MSKAIKLSDEAYQELAVLQRPRETFSQVISRLLATYNAVDKLVATFERSDEFQQWQREQSPSAIKSH